MLLLLHFFFPCFTWSSCALPEGFAVLCFEEQTDLQPGGWRGKACSKAEAGRGGWFTGSSGWLWVVLGCKETPERVSYMRLLGGTSCCWESVRFP